MRFSIILISWIAILVTACSLNTASGNPTATAVSEVPTSAPRPTLTATLTPASTPTTVADDDGDPVSCTPRADWTITYTVIAGDTLGNIAQRADSTVQALATGNCLADPNTLSVGQRLRVPRVVSARLPPTIQAQPVQRGSIAISSFISADAGMYYLLRDDHVTVRWEEAPTNAAKVDFRLLPTGWVPGMIGADTPLIGADFNPADGATIQWQVPADLGEQLVALAYRVDGSWQAFSTPQFVRSAPPPGDGCEIAAASAPGITVYTEPDWNATVFGTLQAGTYVELLGRSLNGWYGFDPGVGQTGDSGVARLRWLLVDSIFVIRGYCPPGTVDSVVTPAPVNETYTNATLGIAFVVPSGWSVQESGYDYLDVRAAGSGRYVMEIKYGPAGQVTPLDEAVANCKATMACLGNRVVLEEETITLDSGLRAVRLSLSAANTPGPVEMVFVVVSDRNLYIRGFNQLDDYNRILYSLRPLHY